MPARTASDVLLYPDHPYRQTHPDQLAVAALAHGLEPPPPASARVLEIGAGRAGSLIAVAALAPEMRAVAFDVSETSVALARERVEALGLANVEVLCADIRELTAGQLGSFDYVIAHGLYSWVSRDAREALPGCVASHLAEGGLGYITFSAQPGGELMRVLRDAALWYAGDETEPLARLERGRDMLGLLAQRRSDDPDDWYGRMLTYEVPAPLTAHPAVVLDGLLSDVWEPTWFHEFAAHLARHGLTYVGESRLLDPPTRNRRPGARERLDALARGDRAALEQYRDLLDCRHHREAVVTHAGATVRADPDAQAMRRLRFGAGDAGHSRAREALLSAAPAFPSFSALADVLGEEGLEAELLAGLALGEVVAYLDPPPAARPGERPLASPVARLQAARGEPVTTLTMTEILLDDAGRVLVGLIDGTRDRAAIARDLAAATGIALGPGQLDATLESMARAALLLA